MTGTTAKVIGLWLDESEPGKEAWIVSRDEMDEMGRAITTSTVECRGLGDHEDAYEQAFEVALDLARKDGLCVIRTEADQGQTCVYAPKVITILDGIGHLQETVRLYGDSLEGDEWVTDILKNNDCAVNDDMDDDAIGEAVRKAWSGEGYEGDPSQNGLAVSVSAEKSIIAFHGRQSLDQ